MRPLRIELRRSAALWSGGLLVVIGLGLFLGLRGPWWRDTYGWSTSWTTLSIWLRWVIQVLGPVALGAGAWQGRRDRRSTMDELLASTPVPTWRRAMWQVGAMAITVTGAYLVFLAAGAVQVSSYRTLTWVPITLVGVLGLVACALVGMGVGRLLPSLFTAPALAVLGLLGLTLLTGTPDEDGFAFQGFVSYAVSLLSPVVKEPHDAFTTVSASVSLLQAVWFIGVIGTAFLLFVAVSNKARALALIPVIAGAAVVVPLLPNEKGGVYTQDPVATALVCAEGTPRVCVSRVHSAQLGALVGPAREALALLAKLPDAPTSVEEATSLWSYHAIPQPKPGVVLIEDFYLLYSPNKRNRILLGPDVFCQSWDDMRRVGASHAVAVAWLTGASAPDPSNYSTPEESSALWASLKALPESAQPARVAELRNASCAS